MFSRSAIDSRVPRTGLCAAFSIFCLMSRLGADDRQVAFVDLTAAHPIVNMEDENTENVLQMQSTRIEPRLRPTPTVVAVATPAVSTLRTAPKQNIIVTTHQALEVVEPADVYTNEWQLNKMPEPEVDEFEPTAEKEESSTLPNYPGGILPCDRSPYADFLPY